LDGNYTKFKKIINSDKIMNSKEGNVMKSFNKEKYAFNSSDEVIVLSEKTKSILIKDYKIPQDKVHLIRNGLSGKSVCSCDNNVSMNEKRILFVGRLDEQKGLKLVINAFKDIAEKLPSAKLYIVGNGNYDHFLPLCEGYRDRIVFTGKMKRCDLEKMYRTASLGVLPSYHEQCSYTIIEMMKFGIPLITSDRMDNLIDNSECVVPIPCVNRINTKVVTRLLSEKMLAILSDKDKWQSLSNKMRTLFDEAYTQHKMVMDLNEMITNSFNRKQYIVPNDYLYILDH
jgi:glycosyltransferase involved in cell wall biosynthesis